METLNSTIKDLLKLVESQKKEITKTHAALVDKSNDRSDVVNKVSLIFIHVHLKHR